MYKISNHSKLQTLMIRGNYLSKKFLVKNRKGVLVYLRSPKHFNIGKHKVFSFNNLFKEKLSFNVSIYLPILLKCPLYFFKFLLKNTNMHHLKKINSLRITLTTNIK